MRPRQRRAMRPTAEVEGEAEQAQPVAQQAEAERYEARAVPKPGRIAQTRPRRGALSACVCVCVCVCVCACVFVCLYVR